MLARVFRLIRLVPGMALLFALAGLAAAGVHAPTARAAPVDASLVYDIAGSNLTVRELGPIDRALKGTFEFYRTTQPQAWRCIRELREFDEDQDENPAPEPLALPVRVDVRVSRSTTLESRLDEAPPVYGGDYIVEVTLSVRGQAPQTRSVTVTPADLFGVTIGRGDTDAADIANIAQAAATLLNGLMGEARPPCAAKATVKVKGEASLNDNPTHYTYEGIADLSLDGEGTFTVETPLAATITMDPVGSCTRAFTVRNPRLRARGGYRNTDGMLVVEELEVVQDAIVAREDCSFREGACIWEQLEGLTNVSGPCRTVGTTSFSLFGGLRGQLHGPDEIAAPLGTVATFALPQPQEVHPNLISWAASLDLEPGSAISVASGARRLVPSWVRWAARGH